jgi:hypothetical protein
MKKYFYKANYIRNKFGYSDMNHSNFIANKQ